MSATVLDSRAAAQAFTLRQEEGRQTAPLAGDPGGATNWGVTIYRLSEWRGHKCTPDDVYALTFSEACAIFNSGYFDALRCPSLWPGLDLMVADHGYNCGLGASAKCLQRALGFVELGETPPLPNHVADGWIGGVTIGAARNIGYAARPDFLRALRDRQEFDYRSKADFPLFGAEWIGNPEASDDWRRNGRLGRRLIAALALLPPIVSASA